MTVRSLVKCFMEKVLENLRVVRTSKNIMQSALAKECGISVRTLIRYENGERLPDVVTALRLARALGTTVEELFPLEED